MNPNRLILRTSLIACAVGVLLAGCNQSQAPVAESSGAAEIPTVTTASAEPERDAAATGPLSLTEVAEPDFNMGSSGLCSIDKINDERLVSGNVHTVTDRAGFTVSGWVGDKATMTRPAATLRFAEATGQRVWEVDAGAGTGRGDVANHFKSDGLAKSGFIVRQDLSLLPAGEYTLSLNHAAGVKRLSCDKGVRIILTP